jgi:hypothetical protein
VIKPKSAAVINYYDTVKATYKKETFKIPNQYNPMTLRNYLLKIGVK